jgi:hypothetical protein
MWWISLIPTIPKNEHDGHFTSPKPAEIETETKMVAVWPTQGLIQKNRA